VTTTTSTSTSPPPTLPPGGSTTSAYQAGVSGPAGSAGVDTNVRLSQATTNFGTATELFVGVTNGADKIYRSFLAFNLTGIPSGAIITDCRLTLNVTQRTNPTAGHVRRICGEHWLDGDGQGENQATWTIWRTGSNWTTAGAASTASCTAGGDYTTTGEVAYTPPTGTGPFTFPNLATLCQDAISQRGGWLRMRITQDVETATGNLIKFDSSEASTAANRPRLVVTWSGSGSVTTTTSAATTTTSTTVTTPTTTSVTVTTSTSTTTRPSTTATPTTVTTTTSTTQPSTTTTTATTPSTTSTTTSTTTTTRPSTTTTSLPTGGTTTNTYQAGVSGPAGSANVDTNVRLSAATTNYGSDSELIVGVTNGPTKVYRSFLAFNLAGIPAGANITSCRLTVNVTQRTNPTLGHIRRLCAQHWLDGDGQGENQATWNVWRTGSNWGSAGAASTASCTSGGDYTTAGEVAYTPPGGTGLFTFPDVTALCQDAISQQGGWLRMRITQDVESVQSNLIKFDSSEAGSAANRPKLVVTWTP
jgi:hypothetical protein